MPRFIRAFIVASFTAFFCVAASAATVPFPKPNLLRVPLPRPSPLQALPTQTVPDVKVEPVEVDPVSLGLAPGATANLQNEFTLEGFFAGETVGRGTIASKTIGVARTFRTATSGTWDGKVLTVIETYQYSFGRPEERVWRFTKTGSNTYLAESREIKGKAEVVINGRKAKLKYKKDFDRGDDKGPLEITHRETWTFDEKGMLSSRTSLRKFVAVGKEAINFVRVGNENALRAPKF